MQGNTTCSTIVFNSDVASDMKLRDSIFLHQKRSIKQAKTISLICGKNLPFVCPHLDTMCYSYHCVILRLPKTQTAWSS